jgi:polar amino acid transport system substrate-binding protein
MTFTLTRRLALHAVTLYALLAGCASVPPPAPPAARTALAPTGTLRVGVYPGSPTSMLRMPGSTDMRGVAVDLGRDLGQRLGVPVEIVVFQRVAEVIDALKASRVDFTVTNATPARAADVDFTAPLIALELGYLSLPGSPVQAIDAVDQPGRRIGVSQGSSSQAALTRQFRQATVVPAPSLQVAAQMLAARELDAFATNKGILFELSDTLPGACVLPGRWGLEHLAIGIPKGRDAGMAWLRNFAEQARASGAVRRAAERAGLRGTVDAGER